MQDSAAMVTTNVFRRNCDAINAGKRRALNEGGTASSKTWSILQLLIQIAESQTSPFLISVVSESFPHLNRGCIRDFKNMMAPVWEVDRWNASSHFYNFGSGVIEFFGLDEPHKATGGRRKILFLNECNNVPYESFLQLDMRTQLFTFCDWNPVGSFWAHDKGMLTDPDNQYIHSTYLDALHVLPQETIRAIIRLKDTDPNAWRIFGLGLMGKIEGLVYPYFSQVDALPQGDCFYGLDFGFSDEPSVLTRHVVHGDALYSEELIFQTHLTNQDLSRRFKDLGLKRNYDVIWADAAEPKSIEEIGRDGWNIKPCPKGEGSVEFGHQKVRQFKQYWTKDSIKCIKEQRNFRYVTDRNGMLTEKTTHQFSHGMDSRRYAVVGQWLEETAAQETVLTYYDPVSISRV